MTAMETQCLLDPLCIQSPERQRKRGESPLGGVESWEAEI